MTTMASAMSALADGDVVQDVEKFLSDAQAKARKGTAKDARPQRNVSLG